MQTPTDNDQLLENLMTATNQHDLEALAECFHPDYDSEFPAHPERAFRGHEPMRQNWSRIFSAVPDVRSTLVTSASIQDTVWAEWEWSGTRIDGKSFSMRGVTIQGITDGKIAWVRLYMEPVERSTVDPESALRQAVGDLTER